MSCMGTELSIYGLHLKDKKVVCILTGTGLKDRGLICDLEPSPPDGMPPNSRTLSGTMALA